MSHKDSKKKEKTSKRAAKSNIGWLKRLFRCIFTVILLLIAMSVVQVVVLKYAPVWRTPLMLKRKAEAKELGKDFTLHYRWISLEEMSHELPVAVMASEDNLFQVHNGFSQRGIRNAIDELMGQGEVRHGGSTISQQTAKNVFTSGNRTYTRKAVEAYYTFLIEHIWGKRRIMEVYLNVIEMGDGVFGTEAAADVFFRSSASRISRSQAALIAACLPNPRRMHVDRPSKYVSRRQQQIIQLIPKLGTIDLDNPENSSIVKKYQNSPK